MGESYHIYIHSNEESSLTSNTQPKETSMGGVFSATKAFGYAKQFATSGFQSAINTGVAALKKVIPEVAIAVGAIKTTDKVLTIGFGHLETYTGHYEQAMDWNNFKTSLSMTLNPIGTLIKQTHIYYQQEKNNRRLDEIRSLIGQTEKIGV